nr:hypothetical protein [Tanacetum cinerariifolium]
MCSLSLSLKPQLLEKQGRRNPHAEEFVVIAHVTKSLDASESAEAQGIQPSIAKTKKEHEIAKEHPLVIPSDDVSESPYDTESEIKFIKSFKANTIFDYAVSSSNLSTMPDDDLHSTSPFDTINYGDKDDNTDMAGSEHISNEGTADTLLHAFAKFHSLLGHLDHNSMPTLISNALKDQLPKLLSKALKECLPSILHDSLPTQLHQTMTKPMKRQFNIYHKAESECFLILQTHLTKVLKSKIRKSVSSKVCTQMQEVKDDLKTHNNTLGRFYLDVQGSEDQLSAKHQLAVKGLSECKALESNKEYAELPRRVRGGNTLTILLSSKEEQAELKDCSLKKEGNLTSEVHPVLPNQDDTMHERPAGKIGLHTRFFYFANFRDPAPVTADFNAQDYATFVARPSSFQKFLEAFLCLVGLSRHYTLDEETYAQFMHKDEKDMDLFAFIHAPDPTKVRVVERERDEGEPRLLETTVGRTISLLPITHDRAERGGQDANIQPVIKATDTIVEDAAPVQSRRQRKRKFVVMDAGEASHPPKKLREDHETLSGAFIV